MSLYITAFSKGWLRPKLRALVCLECREEKALFWAVGSSIRPNLAVIRHWTGGEMSEWILSVRHDIYFWWGVARSWDIRGRVSKKFSIKPKAFRHTYVWQRINIFQLVVFNASSSAQPEIPASFHGHNALLGSQQRDRVIVCYYNNYDYFAIAVFLTWRVCAICLD